jgi:hypothetical protein
MLFVHGGELEMHEQAVAKVKTSLACSQKSKRQRTHRSQI